MTTETKKKRQGLNSGYELNMRLFEWFASLGRDDDVDLHAGSADVSQDGTANPLAAAESLLTDDGSMIATGIPGRHDDGSFRFPHQLRHRYSSGDGAPDASWWKNFFP
jgi:hypothetical protein